MTDAGRGDLPANRRRLFAFSGYSSSLQLSSAEPLTQPDGGCAPDCANFFGMAVRSISSVLSIASALPMASALSIFSGLSLLSIFSRLSKPSRLSVLTGPRALFVQPVLSMPPRTPTLRTLSTHRTLGIPFAAFSAESGLSVGQRIAATVTQGNDERYFLWWGD